MRSRIHCDIDLSVSCANSCERYFICPLFCVKSSISLITPGHKAALFFRISWAISFFLKFFAFCPNSLIFFSSESWKFIFFKFYNARAPARMRARQFHFECWKFTENPKIEEFSENVILARAHHKIWKVWILCFHWKKKLLNLDKNLRF